MITNKKAIKESDLTVQYVINRNESLKELFNTKWTIEKIQLFKKADVQFHLE